MARIQNFPLCYVSVEQHLKNKVLTIGGKVNIIEKAERMKDATNASGAWDTNIPESLLIRGFFTLMPGI